MSWKRSNRLPLRVGVVSELLVVAFLVLSSFPVSTLPAMSETSTSSSSPMPPSDSAFHGLRTVVYTVDDLTGARDWYAEVLGTDPYFDEPFYVGFNVGGYELGLQPSEENRTPGVGGTNAYWGVDDADAAWDRLVDHGASPRDSVQDIGDGVKLETVVDPFGNVLGVIENPQFKAE